MKRTTFLVVEGILLIVAGILAIVLPVGAAVALAVLVAIAFLVTGAFRIIRAISSRRRGWGWAVAAGVIAVAAGVLIILDPFAGVIALTVIIGVYFLVEGIGNIVAAIRYGRDAGGWGWLIVHGVLGILIGVLIVLSWPISAAWFLAILVGINFIFAGVSALALARALRNTGYQ